MTGIICPSLFEYKALDRKRLAGHALIQSGMGKLRAMAACAKLHRQHSALSSVILVGFAGGLTPDLKIGDVIEPHTFIEQDYCAEPLEKFPNVIKQKKNKLLGHSIGAVMLTQDKFLKENPYKNRDLGLRSKTLACDMESYAVAYFCRQMNVPFFVVKLISDCADENAEHDFLAACRKLSSKLNRVVLETVRKAQDFSRE
jgi:adenosylhomocysteine nucleosidase